MKGNGVGRPTKLTPERMKRLTDLIKAGNYIETACCAVGLGHSTYYMWKERGDKERLEGKKTIYTEFLDTVQRAESEAEALSITTITKAEQEGDWKAAAWKLERKNPDKWGRLDRQKINQEHSGEIKITINKKVTP